MEKARRPFKTFWLYGAIGSGLAGLIGCGTGSHPSLRRDHSFTVATYNVENLYDTTHDSKHPNPVYMPLSEKKESSTHRAACAKLISAFFKEQCLQLDWSEDKLKLKMKRIANTVFAMGDNGPDVLILQDVENRKVLKRLNEDFLSAAGYHTAVLLEEANGKELQLAVLSKLPQDGPAVLHEIPFAPDPSEAHWRVPDCNGILEVPLQLPNGERMIVFDFHFPTGNSKVQERQDAALFLNSLKAQKNKTTVIVAGGDSQVSSQEEARTHIQKQILASEWATSLRGCKDCEGTELKQNTWSFSDLLLFSPSIDTDGTAPYVVAESSLQIFKKGIYQLHPDQTPASFEGTDEGLVEGTDKGSVAVGVSSHLPVLTEIRPR